MNEDKNIKTYSLIGAVCSIICSIYFFVRPFSYGATISIYYMVLCVLPYIMIAVLLLLRKKHMMWLIPSGIWLYQTFRQWHWFLFDDTLDCAVAICLILAQTILFIILLCNTIPALEKKAMAINEILWFVPAFLMFIGYVINVFNYYTIRSYYVIDTIMNLLQVIIACKTFHCVCFSLGIFYYNFIACCFSCFFKIFVHFRFENTCFFCFCFCDFDCSHFVIDKHNIFLSSPFGV